jgi:hypothetical protein
MHVLNTQITSAAKSIMQETVSDGKACLYLSASPACQARCCHFLATPTLPPFYARPSKQLRSVRRWPGAYCCSAIFLASSPDPKSARAETFQDHLSPMTSTGPITSALLCLAALISMWRRIVQKPANQPTGPRTNSGVCSHRSTGPRRSTLPFSARPASGA